MPQAPPDFQALNQAWSTPAAEAFLEVPAPSPLPTNGPLAELLAATQRALAPQRVKALKPSHLGPAIQSQAVLLLGRLSHWLQQALCPEEL